VIPNELKKFFEERGRILLIKGAAGTGKTILGFKLLEEMNEFGDTIWVNSRDMDSADISGLEEIVPNERRLDAAHPEETIEPHLFKKNESSKEFMHIYSEVIKALYKEISEIENPTVVIDSFEGLTTELNEMEKEILRVRLARLARDTKANIAVVMETFRPNPLDYLADGVVTLEENTIEDRKIREIRVNKLRGTAINRPKYLFTLEDGKFRYFESFEIEDIARPVNPYPTPDFGDKISTGIGDLDVLLEGGYIKGSVNLFEIERDVGKAYQYLLLPTIINHINQGRGCVYIPSKGEDVARWKRLLTPFIGEEQFCKHVRSLEKYVNIIETKPFVVPCKGKSIDDDVAQLALERRKFKKQKEPVLSIVGLDSLEYKYGLEESAKVMYEWTSDTKQQNDVDILITNRGQKLAGEIEPISNTHWKVMNVDGSIIFFGVLPKTEIYNFSVDVTKGYNNPRLTPVI
jgi:KaiC/GvpD/RAD55 family RecA-like ATPase